MAELPTGRRVFPVVPPVFIIEVPQEVVEPHEVDLRQLAPLLALPFSLVNGHPEEDENGWGCAQYMLAGCTFANGYHFSGAFQSSGMNHIRHGWYAYDGLTGHRFAGNLPPGTPPGSNLSFVIYNRFPQLTDTHEAMQMLAWGRQQVQKLQ